MKIKYFSDTDTALLEFNDKNIEQTIEISNNIYIDIDADGNIINMTIEHAKENAKLPEFSYQEIANSLKKSA